MGVDLTRAGRAAGHVLGLALAALALLHTYWALGGTRGLDAALGGPAAPRPPAALVWLIAGALAGAAAGTLIYVRAPALPRPLAAAVRAGLWALAAALLGAAALNARAPTALERWAFAPLALALAGLALLALRGRAA